MSTVSLQAQRDILLDHSRRPRRHFVLLEADGTGECRNPLCGDHVVVNLKLNPDRTFVERVAIQVSGCAIATASASLMTEMIEKTEIEDVRSRVQLAIETISAIEGAWPNSMLILQPLEMLRRNPRKIACALMAWFALKNALAAVERRPLSKSETVL